MSRREGVPGCKPSIDRFPPYGMQCVLRNWPINPPALASLRIKPSRFHHPFDIGKLYMFGADVKLIADDGPGTWSDRELPFLSGTIRQSPCRYWTMDDGAVIMQFRWDDLCVTQAGWFRFKVEFFYYTTEDPVTQETVEIASIYTTESFRVI